MIEAVKPLGLVSAVVAELGLSVTYVYEDLVFISHNAFLLQFTDKPNQALLYFNAECPDDEAEKLKAKIVSLGKAQDLEIIPKGRYELSQGEGENMDLRFF